MAGNEPIEIQLTLSTQGVETAFEKDDNEKTELLQLIQEDNTQNESQQQLIKKNNNENDINENNNNDEWSRSYDINFDYYEEHNTETEEEEKIYHDDEEEEEEYDSIINSDLVIKNISICLGFLLDKNSPLWKDSVKHHSTTELLSGESAKKKKKYLKFSDLCSIFKSNYILGLKSKKKKKKKKKKIKKK
eukprot:453980_1